MAAEGRSQEQGAQGRPHLPTQASPNAGHLDQPGLEHRAGADRPHPAHIKEHFPAPWCRWVSFALGWDRRCCDPDQMETSCAELGVGGRGPCELPVLGTCPCPPGSQAPSAPLLHAVSLALIKRRLQLRWPGKAPRPRGVLAAEVAALRLRLALKPQSGESRANPSTETLPSTESQVY